MFVFCSSINPPLQLAQALLQPRCGAEAPHYAGRLAHLQVGRQPEDAAVDVLHIASISWARVSASLIGMTEYGITFQAKSLRVDRSDFSYSV